MHPAIAELATLIGIDPERLLQGIGEVAESVDRIDGQGNYWRLERHLQCDGPREWEIDHVIESRPREVQGIRRIETDDGILSITVHPGRILPDVVMGALEGRRLGQIFEITGAGADLKVVSAKTRIMGADGISPLQLRFETISYLREARFLMKGEKTCLSRCCT